MPYSQKGRAQKKWHRSQPEGATSLSFFLLFWWLSGKEPNCQCRRHGFDPWVGMILWRRKWQPTLVSLPGKSHGQRSLGATVHDIAKTQAQLSNTSLNTSFYITLTLRTMVQFHSTIYSVDNERQLSYYQRKKLRLRRREGQNKPYSIKLELEVSVLIHGL